MSQFDDVLTSQNIGLAFTRLKTANSSLYKTLYYEDLKIFEEFLDSNIFTLSIHLQQSIYKPEDSYKYYIPKKNNLVRPITLLKFLDLLVYQAIANVIADHALDIINPYYNHVIFGNVINSTKATQSNNLFFFKNWKNQWKRFKELSREYHSMGYKFIAEFDIASFFDTIDHSILIQILKNEFGIEDEILQLLEHCLETWTCDANHKKFKCRHGIPQGPIASSLLADLYLFYLDREVLDRKNSHDFHYIRYVDDIRIYTKTEGTAQKIIALLDLESRDLGLIPQGGKIKIKKVEDIETELKEQDESFSKITNEYKKDNDGKPKGQLKTKTHNRLKKRFLNCFDKKSSTYLDKTIIKFSLFKLNEDKEVKEILLNKFSEVNLHAEGIFFYLRKYYGNDKEIIDFLISIIQDPDLLYHHIIALIFKEFPDLPFNTALYHKYYVEGNRHWLIRYYMIEWLYKNGAQESIILRKEDNYFVNREINYRRFTSAKIKEVREIQVQGLILNLDGMTALQGIQLIASDFSLFKSIEPGSNYNPYIAGILTNQVDDYINHTINLFWEISYTKSLFNSSVCKNVLVYKELNISFKLFYDNKEKDASKSLMNLNLFNHLLFDTICENLRISKPANEYGSNLKANIIESILPICNQYWTEINDVRNQKTEAHPFDKIGQIRIRVTQKELLTLIEKEKKCIKELADFYNQHSEKAVI